MRVMSTFAESVRLVLIKSSVLSMVERFLQTEEIKLDRALILCIFHGIHRLQCPFLPGADRHHLTDILIHDDYTCSMSPEVSIQIFQLPTELNQTLFIFTAFSGEDCQFPVPF